MEEQTPEELTRQGLEILGAVIADRILKDGYIWGRDETPIPDDILGAVVADRTIKNGYIRKQLDPKGKDKTKIQKTD